MNFLNLFLFLALYGCASSYRQYSVGTEDKESLDPSAKSSVLHYKATKLISFFDGMVISQDNKVVQQIPYKELSTKYEVNVTGTSSDEISNHKYFIKADRRAVDIKSKAYSKFRNQLKIYLLFHGFDIVDDENEADAYLAVSYGLLGSQDKTYSYNFIPIHTVKMFSSYLFLGGILKSDISEGAYLWTTRIAAISEDSNIASSLSYLLAASHSYLNAQTTVPVIKTIDSRDMSWNVIENYRKILDYTK